MSSDRNMKTKLRGLAMRHMPLMITCKELEGFIDDFLEGKLPYKQHQLFKLHLRLCDGCLLYVGNYKQTIALSKDAYNNTDLSSCEDMPEALVKAILSSRKAGS